MRALNASETKVLSMAIKREPGMTLCSTWNVTDHHGETISVGFVARANPETQDDGSERLICRAMNWRAEYDGPSLPPDHLAQRILDGLAQPGVHRALGRPGQLDATEVARRPRAVLRLARREESGEPSVNPADAMHMARMTLEFGNGSTSGVLRLRANDGGWTPVHMTINRVELEENTFAGLMALRLPTEAELAVVDFDEPTTRNNRRNRRKRSRGKRRSAKVKSAKARLTRASAGPARAAAPAAPALMVTTTSSPSTTQSATPTPIASAIAEA